MPTRHRRRHVVPGNTYAAGPGDGTTGAPSGGSAGPPGPLAHLTASPEELGIIGAELAKRLTLAAEEFLSELAANQVRGSFRQEMGDFLGEPPEE